MAEAGQATLPDLDAPFAIAEDIVAALQAEPDAWAHFLAFPELYRRVRLGYVEDARRNPVEFERRVRNLVTQTARNQMFGSWNDNGRLG